MKFRRSQRLKVRAGLDMTPMVTVVFNLLLFFMLGSTFVVHSEIKIRGAEAEGLPVYEQKDLSITLARGEGGPDGKGPVYVNEIPIQDMTDLTRLLTEAHAERPDLRVLIRPDARLDSGRLIEVLSLVNSAGIEQYAIAAQPTTATSEP